MKQQTHIHKLTHKQLGYTLLELSIVLTIMALVIMAVISMQVEQAKNDKARSVAETYIRINNAAGSYLTNYYDELRRLDPDCGHADWRSGGTGGYLINKERCRLHLVNGYLRAKAASEPGAVLRVENGLRPTPDELVSLGLLSGFASGLPLPTVTWVDGGRLTSSGSDQNWGTGTGEGQLPIRFMVLINFICADPAFPAGPFYDRRNCGTSYDLRSLTFNTQPYRLESTSLGPGFLWKVLQHIGSDGFLSGVKDSMPGETGELRGIGANAIITNPTRTQGGNPAPYVLAIRNGYGSSGWDRFVRRDGSTPMTADWNYGNTNVTNISNMAVNSGLTVGNTIPDSTNGAGGTGSLTVNGATVMGTEKAERNGDTVLTVKGSTNIKGNSVVSGDSAVTGNSSVGGNSTVGGTLNASKGIFGKVTDTVSEALGAALQAASAYIQGPLTVGGDAKIKGSASVGGNLITDGYIFAKEGIRMDKYRRVGEVCDPSIETLALQLSGNKQFADGLRLLVCTHGSKAWEYPQPDLNGKIDSIWTTINQGNFKINKTAKLGESCASTEAPLAWQDSSTAAYTKGLRLLVCPPTSLQWSYPQPDIQAQLDAINSNLQSQIDDLKKSKSTAFIEYRTVPNVDLWQVTDLPCDKWSSPYLTSSGTGDDSGFKIDVWCDGTWKVLGYNGHGSSTGYTFGFIRIKN